MSIETMTKLATATVDGSAPTSVTFTDIPQGYTDLKLIVSARSTRSGVDRSNDIFVRLNGISSGYILKCLGDSPPRSTTSSSDTGMGRIQAPADDATAGIFGNAEITVHNYSGNRYKIMSADSAQEDSATYAAKWFVSSQVPTTAPITSVTFIADQSATLQQYSTFTIYGIKNAAKTAGNSIKATGGNIIFDGTYVYHVFNASGSFIPTQGFLADYLVIGGGGAGSPSRSGGGGAGGLLSSIEATGGGGTLQPEVSFVPTSYTVTVGAGGATALDAVVYSGSNSAITGFTTPLTAIGGGGGGNSGAGGQASGAGAVGGSGGGGLQGPTAGGLGTANQGYRGGNGSSSYYGGAGGGGAGGQGVDFTGPTNDGTNGGPGLLISSIATATKTGVNGYYAGGGGGGYFSANAGSGTAGSTGGTGGIGGGGAGSAGGAGTAGTANTGGGGGAGRGNSGGTGDTGGANGGSGLVIIRYKG